MIGTVFVLVQVEGLVQDSERKRAHVDIIGSTRMAEPVKLCVSTCAVVNPFKQVQAVLILLHLSSAESVLTRSSDGRDQVKGDTQT